MIRFEDGELLNLLPVSMAKDIETQCISYALQRQIQRIIYHASRTRTVAMIDMLPCLMCWQRNSGLRTTRKT